YQIKYDYAGRGVAKPGQTILWSYITKPKYLGLFWVDKDGNVFIGDEKIHKIEEYRDSRLTHNKLMAMCYNKLRIDKKFANKDDLIYFCKKVCEEEPMNVRGRIVNDDIFIYRGSNQKIVDKAIDAIYKYIG
ncbi:MAG: hypothetical protein ACOC56_01695, partial [Atribacterota bacterium]